MGYMKAEEILPIELIELIQKYVDGQNIYIPKKADSRAVWGSNTEIRMELQNRNQMIYEEYVLGKKTAELAKEYYLSEKSIQRIVRERKEYEKMSC